MFTITLPASDTSLCISILEELRTPVVASFTTNLLVDKNILSALLINAPSTDLGTCTISISKGKNIICMGTRLRPLPRIRQFINNYSVGQIMCKTGLGYPNTPAWEINTDGEHIRIDFISYVAYENFKNKLDYLFSK
jgi:hypothetical protein